MPAAKESSLLVLFRALVMLACLVLVPLAAVFGSAFPDVVKQWLVRPILARLSPQATESAPAAADASSQQPGSTAPAALGAGPAPHEPAPSVMSAPPATASLTPPANLHAERNWPAEAATARQAGAISVAPPAVASVMSDGRDGREPAAVDSSGRFSHIERRLRELGATHYVLQTWGSDGQLYRFQCKIAVNADPHVARQFEAVDHDALNAMEIVQGQIEQWLGAAVTRAPAAVNQPSNPPPLRR